MQDLTGINPNRLLHVGDRSRVPLVGFGRSLSPRLGLLFIPKGCLVTVPSYGIHQTSLDSGTVQTMVSRLRTFSCFVHVQVRGRALQGLCYESTGSLEVR
jgi:hypothetical protein